MALRLFLVLLLALSAGLASAREQPHRVLLLHSFRSAFPVNAVFASGITKGLNPKADIGVEIDSESLDLTRLDEVPYAEMLIEIYQARYRSSPPDLIIATYTPALQFLLDHGERLFPGVPIVYCAAEETFIDTTRIPANVTGVASRRDFAGTLELMSQLQSDMQHVVMIVGSGKIDREWEQDTRRALRPYEDRFDFIWLRGLPQGELVERVKALPIHSAILFVTQFADRNGTPNVPRQTLQAVAEAANAPVYGLWDTLMGTGMVGGRLVNIERQGELSGQIARRVLVGEAPKAIQAVRFDRNDVMVDARQLKKWDIDERRLPAGSVVLHREPSIWEAHRDTIVVVLGVIALQALWIVALLVNRSRLQRARTSLADEYDHRVQAENTSRKLQGRMAAVEKQSNLGVLAADISHEISQPLISIKNYAQAARRYVSSEAPHANKLQELLTEVEGEAGRAGAIIHKTRRLLETGRVDAVAVELRPILDEVLMAMGAELESHRCRAEYADSTPLPPVLADALQVQLVMINLLRNAMEAMDSSAAGDSRLITIHTRMAGEQELQVSVADRGAGVPPDAGEDIFDSLYTTKAAGMGVGLATCRTIVEAHGGRIWCTPNPLGGAVFHFTLPVA